MEGIDMSNLALPAENSDTLESIALLSERAQLEGASDAAVLLALAKRRGDYDGLAIFCTLNGFLMRIFGAWVVVLLESVALICLLTKIASYGDDVFTWIKDKFGSVIAILTAIAGIGGLGVLGYSLWSNQKDETKHDMIGITTSALKGFIIGMFPGPVAGALNAIAVEVGGTFGIGPGTAATPSMLERATAAVRSVLPGDDEGYDEATIAAVADAFETDVEDVLDMIGAKA
jgi:hypothetical protein